MGFAAVSACPLQVATCLLSVLSVKTQQGAKLQVRLGFSGLQWLEGEHGLQAVHAQG